MPAASLPCRPLCNGRTAFPFYAQRSFGSRKNNVGPKSGVLKTGLPASPGPVLAGRTAFWQSCFDVDSARKQGGFSLPPGGAGGGSGGWGGGSGGGGESSDDGGGYVLRGFGVAAASFFTLAKSVVCWCSGDPKATATDIDLGFLLSMAMLALVALAPTPMMLLRSVRAAAAVYARDPDFAPPMCAGVPYPGL